MSYTGFAVLKAPEARRKPEHKTSLLGYEHWNVLLMNAENRRYCTDADIAASATSEAKAKAARDNGARTGRPRRISCGHTSR
jgi:hypothetical protein